MRHDADAFDGERSVWVHVVRLLVKFACTHGIRREDLIPQAYRSQIETGAPYHRVPLAVVYDIVERAAEEIEHFGIHAAKKHNSWNENVVGFLMSTSATFGAAIDNTTRFRRIIMDGDAITLVRGKKEARFIFQPNGPRRPAQTHFCEFLFYQLAIGSQAILGRPFEILKIRFRHTVDAEDTFLQKT
ncbi:MAG: AraC family transcriptional regulator ligand-binding domain-containing protein, partial [Myxococcota bacterium]